jgi:hypothetical protein
MVISWAPALLLAVTIGVGMSVAPTVRWELVLDLGVVSLGAATALAGRRGATAAAVVPTVLLAFVAILLVASGARLQGGTGTAVAAPRDPAALRNTYRLAAGSQTIDLRGLHGSAGGVAKLQASVGIGELTIAVPDNARGRVVVRIGAGALESFGNPPSGFDLRRTIRIVPDAEPGGARSRLSVDVVAEVGRGCVTILQGYQGSITDPSCPF